MEIITICFGFLLTLLGIGNYTATDETGLLAFMPVVFGILITLFGLLLQGKWGHRNHLFGSMLLAILTLIGSFRGLWRFFTLLTGGEPGQLTQAAIIPAIMGGLAVVFIILSVTLIEDFWHGWKEFGQFLGDWLARVVLTIFYFTVMVPFGLGVRLFSDPLKIKTQPAQLWRSRSTGDQKIEDIQRQF